MTESTTVPIEMERLAEATGWVLDVDGCLVSTTRAGGAGGVAIPGAIEFVAALRESGRSIRVCTNASQKSPREYAQHLRSLGFDIRDDEFLTAGSAAALYLADHHPGSRILVLGESGLLEPIREVGLEVVTDPSDEADVVVVGADDHYSTEDLNAACLAVADRGSPLYVTVDTPWFHGGRGRSICVSAAIAHAITWVTGVQPTVLGKPSPALAETLRRQLGGADMTLAVVGDAPAELRLAQEMDAFGLLVLTGATRDSDVAGLGPELRPHLVADSVRHINSLLSPYL
ncbi:MAG: HAD-IIA family hydrolase [Microbacteriaceae bacterium]